MKNYHSHARISLYFQILDHFYRAFEVQLWQAFAPRQIGRKFRVLKKFSLPKKILMKKYWFFLSILLTPLWNFHNAVTKIHNGVMKFITALWKSCHNVAARPRKILHFFSKFVSFSFSKLWRESLRIFALQVYVGLYQGLGIYRWPSPVRFWHVTLIRLHYKFEERSGQIRLPSIRVSSLFLEEF